MASASNHPISQRSYNGLLIYDFHHQTQRNRRWWDHSTCCTSAVSLHAWGWLVFLGISLKGKKVWYSTIILKRFLFPLTWWSNIFHSFPTTYIHNMYIECLQLRTPTRGPGAKLNSKESMSMMYTNAKKYSKQFKEAYFFSVLVGCLVHWSIITVQAALQISNILCWRSQNCQDCKRENVPFSKEWVLLKSHKYIYGLKI